MRKLLYVFLSIIISYSNIQAQSIEGNFELDSLVVEYTIVSRDIEQTGNDGNTYTTTYDANSASYEVTIGWPGAGEDALFEFSLPYWEIGDTMAVTTVNYGSAVLLDSADVKLNVDFTDGAYTINTGSKYPTTNTTNCVTTPVVVPLQDAGTWTNGGYQPIQLSGNRVKWGWGIIESGVFATFEAPDMANDVLGTDYGAGTPMESWGYFQANYTDNTYSTVDGLNIGWEAHDSESANLGIVSDGDPDFVQAEADLGLLNGMLGRSSLPVDSVTIGAVAQQAALAGITINVPEIMPYAVGATGLPGTEADPVIGDTTSDHFYIFDPKGDLLGGGDGIAFSGDEGLRFTGYYATWNTLITLNGITDGAGAAVAAGALANNDVPMLVDSVLDYTLGYWDMSEDTKTLIKDSVRTDAITTVGGLLTQGLGLTEVGNALLPYVLGKVTSLQANPNNNLTHSNGDVVVVDDSGQDLDFDEFNETIYYATGALVNHTGGRIWAAMDPICFPAKWTQRVDSHWSYMGALSTVNDDDHITADRFELKGNYPNPFNPTTKIRFSNDRNSNVRVNVYALSGEKVATIMDRRVNAGVYDVSWNGKNSNGKIVPTGMYLYDIESDGRRLQGKMLFVK
ncbi:MAG: hypothetical protein CML88_02005 [Rhodobiaceae bacterium]|nr:hypothetical protein [Rhodobiaceae bacterium]